MEAIDKKRIRQDKKNLLRRQFRQEARAAIFINEYVKAKHEEIYEEAAAFYNYVNNIYPQKSDLRKAEEFKAMKLGFTFVVKQKNNVVKDLRQVYLPITTTNQENFTVIAYKDPQADTVPVTTFPSTTEQANTVPVTTFPSTTQQADTVPVTTFPSTTQQADTVPGKDKPEKIMQLRIPLMSSRVMTAKVTQEILEENPLTTVCNELLPPDIQPTLDGEIPEEAYNQILAGLRQARTSAN